MSQHASVTFDGMTVESNHQTEDQIRQAIGAPEKAAPVVTPKAEAPVADVPATDDDADDAAVDPASEAGKTLAKKKQHYAERIGELTKNWRTAERDRDASKAELARLKAELDTLKTGTPARETPAPPASSAKAPEYLTRPKPKSDEIGTTYAAYEDYVEDLTDWKADERDAKREQAARAATHDRTQRDRLTKFNGGLDAARQKYADFDTVMADAATVNVAPWIADAILESDVGQDLRYYLLKHRSELERLAGLSPIKAVAALGKLEDKLDPAPPVAAASGTTTKGPPATNAKPIPTPLGGSPVASDESEASDDLDVDAFIRKENAKEAKARRR